MPKSAVKLMNSSKNKMNNEISVRLGLDKNENYFTNQLIFATIHRLHCTFGTIHGFYCTISTNFYLYLQYFQ